MSAWFAKNGGVPNLYEPVIQRRNESEFAEFMENQGLKGFSKAMEEYKQANPPLPKSDTILSGQQYHLFATHMANKFIDTEKKNPAA